MGGVLRWHARYYDTISPDDPRHTGKDEIFVRVSRDLGQTWSVPTPVARGIDVQRVVTVKVRE